MKVLQISKFYPPVLGGIEAVAWEISEGLLRSGVANQVICSDQRFWGRTERFATGYDVVRAGRWGMLLSTSVAPAMALHLARRTNDVDIVHVHMPDPMAAAAIWAVRPRGKVVVHWHSDVIRQRRALRLYEPLQRWLLERADAVIATSPPYAESSLPLQPWRSKVEVVPIGISDNHTDACSVQAAAVRRAARGRRIIFSLGRVTYYKGFEVLIEAARSLPDDCVVYVGGEGELLDEYRKSVARQGLAGKVQFLGHINDAELASYFEACDIFCMPSTLRAEAYGVAIVEAMVMGKPIVASDIPGSGVPWVNVHGETGFNVPAGSAPALSEALCKLLANDHLRARLGVGSRQRYERQFGAQLMIERILNLYRRLVTEAHS